MTEDWEYKFQKELLAQIDTLLEYIITHPSNDPRILNALDQINEETDLIKVYELLVSLIPIIAESSGILDSMKDQIGFCKTLRYSERINELEKRKESDN